MAIDTSSQYSFSMEDLLNLPDFNLDLDNFSVDTPSSDSNSQSQHSNEHTTHPSSPSTPATVRYACASNGCGCGVTFHRPSQLKKHVEQRTRPHACSQNGCTVRPFSSKHDLNRHEREVHGCAAAGGRAVRLRCPHASCKRHHRGFGRKENLALHMRTMHPDGATNASSPEIAVEPTALPMPPVKIASNHETPAVNGSASEKALQAALQDRLAFLCAHRAALASQLQSVDEQINAVQCTVSGLQGLDLGLLGLGVGLGGGEWQMLE